MENPQPGHIFISNNNILIKNGKLVIKGSTPVLPPDPPEILLNATAWYDASSLLNVVHIDGEVSQWLDKSGNNHIANAYGTTKPSITTEQQNGLSVLSFSSGDYMSSAGVFNTGNSSYAVFAAWKATADLGHLLYAGGMGQPNQALIIRYHEGVLGHDWFGNELQVAQLPSTICSCMYYDADNNKRGTNINGINTEQDITTDVNLAIGDVDIGRSKYGDGLFTGWIGELLIYTTCPTLAERTQIMEYLSSKWGI